MLARIVGGRGPFLNGLGQDVTEGAYVPPGPGSDLTVDQPAPVATPGGGSNLWQSILPGVFKTGEQVFVQTTRPAGTFQQVTPYGSVTYAMPTSGPAAGAPSPYPASPFGPTTGAGFGSWVPLIFLGVLGFGAVAAFSRRS